MKKYLALTLLTLFVTATLADVPAPEPPSQKQPRTLGQKAVLHIYYYAPKTLEITYVDSYLFKDESTCRSAISAALQIAVPYAGAGDMVSAKCIGLTPPEPVTQPDKRQTPSDSTEL
jgi:hypothetical protein